jgi:hypothetical protein
MMRRLLLVCFCSLSSIGGCGGGDGGPSGNPGVDARSDIGADGTISDTVSDTDSDAGNASDVTDSASDADARADTLDADEAGGSSQDVDAAVDSSVDSGGGVLEERFGFISVGGDGLAYLWDMRTDGTDMKTLPMTGEFGIADASWSGDGRRVAFTTYAEGYQNSLDELLPVMVMNTDGTGLEQVGTGRFPSFSGDGTFLAWVSHSLQTTTDDPPRTVRKFDLHTHFFDGREPVRLSSTLGGAVTTGPSVSEGIPRLVARSTPEIAVFATYQSSRPDEQGFSINETMLLKFREGGADIVARVQGEVEGVTFMGVDYRGDAWWAEWRTVGEDVQEATIRSTGGEALAGQSRAGGMLFSPNALRTLQYDGGFWWFGTPTYEEQVRVEFGLPTAGLRTWFEVR